MTAVGAADKPYWDTNALWKENGQGILPPDAVSLYDDPEYIPSAEGQRKSFWKNRAALRAITQDVKTYSVKEGRTVNLFKFLSSVLSVSLTAASIFLQFSPFVFPTIKWLPWLGLGFFLVVPLTQFPVMWAIAKRIKKHEANQVLQANLRAGIQYNPAETQDLLKSTDFHEWLRKLDKLNGPHMLGIQANAAAATVQMPGAQPGDQFRDVQKKCAIARTEQGRRVGIHVREDEVLRAKGEFILAVAEVTPEVLEAAICVEQLFFLGREEEIEHENIREKYRAYVATCQAFREPSAKAVSASAAATRDATGALAFGNPLMKRIETIYQRQEEVPAKPVEQPPLPPPRKYIRDLYAATCELCVQGKDLYGVDQDPRGFLGFPPPVPLVDDNYYYLQLVNENRLLEQWVLSHPSKMFEKAEKLLGDIEKAIAKVPEGDASESYQARKVKIAERLTAIRRDIDNPKLSKQRGRELALLIDQTIPQLLSDLEEREPAKGDPILKRHKFIRHRLEDLFRDKIVHSARITAVQVVFFSLLPSLATAVLTIYFLGNLWVGLGIGGLLAVTSVAGSAISRYVATVKQQAEAYSKAEFLHLKPTCDFGLVETLPEPREVPGHRPALRALKRLSDRMSLEGLAVTSGLLLVDKEYKVPQSKAEARKQIKAMALPFKMKRALNIEKRLAYLEQKLAAKQEKLAAKEEKLEAKQAKQEGTKRLQDAIVELQNAIVELQDAIKELKQRRDVEFPMRRTKIVANRVKWLTPKVPTPYEAKLAEKKALLAEWEEEYRASPFKEKRNSRSENVRDRSFELKALDEALDQLTKTEKEGPKPQNEQPEFRMIKPLESNHDNGFNERLWSSIEPHLEPRQLTPDENSGFVEAYAKTTDFFRRVLSHYEGAGSPPPKHSWQQTMPLLRGAQPIWDARGKDEA